jgi:integrase/recombinase XerC
MDQEENQQTEALQEEDEASKFLANPSIVLEWKKHHIKEGHTVHSTITYFNYIKRFVGYGIKINQKTVDKFRENSMAGACSGALKSFFKFLVIKKGWPRETMFIYFDKSKSTKKFPNSIHPLEVKKLIDAMPTLKNKNLTLTIYDLGLRLSEALRLKWSDFNWIKWLQDKTKQGEVDLTHTKGGKFRSIPVSVELMERLYNDHQLRTPEGIPLGVLIFDFGSSEYLLDKSKSIEENQYNYIVVHSEDKYRRLLYKISLEVLNKRINPHILRHSKAQDMMDHNVPIESIKRYLGHARISSTEIYAQASAEKLKSDLEVYQKQVNNETAQNQASNPS